MKMLSLGTGSGPELRRAEVDYLCSQQSWSFPKVCKYDRHFQAAVNNSLLHPPGCCQLQFNPPRFQGCFCLPAVTGADAARCRSGSVGVGRAGAPRAAGSCEPRAVPPAGGTERLRERCGSAAGARPPLPGFSLTLRGAGPAVAVPAARRPALGPPAAELGEGPAERLGHACPPSAPAARRRAAAGGPREERQRRRRPPAALPHGGVSPAPRPRLPRRCRRAHTWHS